MYRICLIGPPRSGKSTWLKRWTRGTYDITPSIDTDMRSMSISTSKGTIRIIVYDVSDRFGYIYCHNMDLCIVIFDMSDRESFTHAIICRREFERRYPKIPVITIGNKIDIGIATRNVEYMCSAKTGEGTNEIYLRILKLLAGENIELKNSSCWIL